MDKITLSNMVFFGYHGALKEEQDIGGRFEVDVELFGDFSQPAQSDRLSDAVNYKRVFEVVKEKVEGARYHLIESLAGDVAKTILEEFSVARVNVRLRKSNVPIGGVIDFVEVELSREKGTH